MTPFPWNKIQYCGGSSTVSLSHPSCDKRDGQLHCHGCIENFRQASIKSFPAWNMLPRAPLLDRAGSHSIRPRYNSHKIHTFTEWIPTLGTQCCTRNLKCKKHAVHLLHYSNSHGKDVERLYVTRCYFNLLHCGMTRISQPQYNTTSEMLHGKVFIRKLKFGRTSFSSFQNIYQSIKGPNKKKEHGT